MERFRCATYDSVRLPPFEIHRIIVLISDFLALDVGPPYRRQKKAEREDVSLQRIDQVKIDVHYSLRVIGFARRFIILPSSLNAVQGMQLNGDARRGRKGLNVIPVLRFLPSVVLRGVGEPKPMKSILVGAYIVQGMDFKAFQDKARQERSWHTHV